MLSVMEVFKDDVSQLEIGSSVESLQTLLVSQRDLFHGQIDQFQKIVVTQCKLAGINPLSQEMVLFETWFIYPSPMKLHFFSLYIFISFKILCLARFVLGLYMFKKFMICLQSHC